MWLGIRICEATWSHKVVKVSGFWTRFLSWDTTHVSLSLRIVHVSAGATFWQCSGFLCQDSIMALCFTCQLQRYFVKAIQLFLNPSLSVSVLVREFCKILILIKYNINSDLAYRTPLNAVHCQCNWKLLSAHTTLHYGEVEKNGWKWSTLRAYFSAVFFAVNT